MPTKFKMIGFDLDGTLLTSEKKITEYTRDVLVRAAGLGIILLPVTGRPLSGIPKEISTFPGIRYAITANGARVVDMSSGEMLLEELVSVEIARKILDIFEHYDTLREIYYDGIGYAQEDSIRRIGHYFPDEFMAQYVAGTRIQIPNVRARFEEENRSVDKMQAIFASGQERKAAIAELEKLPYDLEITGALANNIEVNAPGVHKGKALLWLGEKLGINAEEILVFGDGENDATMLKAAGVGIAVANSARAAKLAADMVTLSNDEEGVAKAIEEYALQPERKRKC